MLRDRDLSSLKPGSYLSESAHRGAGRLQVRALKNGAKMFYFRYVSDSNTGARDSLPLGHYDPKGIKGLTLVQAKNKAGELSRIFQSGTRSVRGLLDSDGTGLAPNSGNRIDPVSSINVPKVQGRTLGEILEGYIEYQHKAGKIDARNVESTIRANIIDAHPGLCGRIAATLTATDLLPIIQPLTDRGAFGMAKKTRGYLCTTYTRAMKADFDTTAPELLKGAFITSNPLLQLPTFSEHDGVGDRNLAPIELALYVNRVKQIDNANIRGALLLTLYLGGQRMSQLLRATVSSINLEGEEIQDEKGQTIVVKVITISDPKGRGKPRSRKLPLFGEAERIVLELMELNLGRDFIFCGKDNKKLDPSIPSKIPSLISTDLISEKKISAHFTFSDLRRTCETQLAKLKISKDIRAQVLSHGIGGIQDKHYDRHDYLPEKYDALIKWTMRISEICESHCGDKGGDVEVLSDL